MPDSINSLSPDFRDFLLNRNLITDSVTNNGLDGLLVGIGVPFSNIGTPPEAVQPSPDILVDGDLYKDLNLVTNKFQGNDTDYRLASITYQSSITPPASAFIYSASYTEDDGVLNDTLNTPANGAFQGGDIRQFNTSKNLYDDPSMRLTVNMDDVLLPNVKYTNYIDLNASIVNPAIDVLGSIFNGQGVGISPTGGGLVPTFDLRSSLVGRVLGGTGVIADTPIGQAGAKYLAIALANNAAFGLQQETLGNLNLNPLNIAKNGLGGIIVPNYDITVPSGKLGKVLDFGAKVLGFESPFSLYERGASIWGDENPISNIDRANAQIANTGKGQVLAMFANVKENRYRPAYQDDRIKGGDDQYDANGERTAKAQKGSGINPNIYAFGTSDGKIIDFLNNNVDVDGDGNIVDGEGSDVNTPISQSNYGLEGLVRDSGFESLDNLSVSYSNPFVGGDKAPDNGTTDFIWTDNNRNYLGGRELDIYDGTEFKNDKTILAKTQRLFNSGKMRTLTTGKSIQQNKTQINSSVAGEQGSQYMSKGSGVLRHNSPTEIESDADNMFCRTWTTFDKYDQVQDLQKNSGINGNTEYRKGLVDGDSVLGNNGFVKIGPYVGDELGGEDGNNNIKNFMFSLENLAWADNDARAMLLPCEIGPGDPMGKRGRIMWFPPYDLSITENTSVNWESTNFIGRGEPIYTYNNTERTGTLQFKIVVDHPSYLNAIRSESDEYIASFFAGCTDIDSVLAEKLTTTEKDSIESRNAPPAKKKDPAVQDPGLKELVIYLPNDVSVPDSNYEDKATEELDDAGTTTDSGTVSFTKSSSTNRTNFGLNGDKNDTLSDKGGWITAAGVDAIKVALNEKCPACTIDVKGFASQQGQVLNPSGNKKIQIDRANEMRKWLEENVLAFDPNIVSGKITYNDRFKPWNDANKVGGVIGCTGVEGINDTNCLKTSRKATANFLFDADLALKLTDNETDPILPVKEKFKVSKKIINRFYNECNYFEKLRQEDAVVYSTLKEKLRFFHPAFHAITPEGLNSRLTFLQQCTRQGPTNSDNTPDNLAFGRPPICILRLGDFYHTKIAIDNVGISYEPLVWDLNPEGIGVQPMIATVDLSFKMIGGQSMKGPINKLQNAVSFNFFGNTQIYDERSDTIVKNTDTETPGDYKIKPGLSVLTPSEDNVTNEEKLGINGDGNETTGIDQPALVAKQPVEEQEPSGSTINNIEVARNIGLKSFYYDADGFEFELTCTYGGREFLLAPIDSNDKTTSPIKCDVIVVDGGSTTREQKSVGTFTISHNSTTNTIIENGNPNPADAGVKEFKVSLTEYDDDVAEFLNTAIANGSNIKLVKSVGGKTAGKYNLGFNNTANTF